MPEIQKFRCVPYTGSKNGKSFMITAEDDEKALVKAKEQAGKTEHTHLFVETVRGRQLYDAAV